LSKETYIEILSQIDNKREIARIGTGEWTTLYAHDKGGPLDTFRFSALIPSSEVPSALSRVGWELTVENGSPGFSQSNVGGATVATYHRFGLGSAEPIVFIRDWHGLKPRQLELLEEFRHFHNLYHDWQNGRYILVDNRGEDEIVAEVSESSIRVKTRRIRQFLAVRQLFLVFYFDDRAVVPIDVAAAKSAIKDENLQSEDTCYSFHVSRSMGKTVSRLVGKKLIRPFPIHECGVWPYEQKRTQFADFLIGMTSEGLNIQSTCNPDELRNNFGKNLDAPDYPHVDRDVALLKDIQTLRSTGAAHRRGSNFARVSEHLRLNELLKTEIFRQLLGALVQMLDDLSSHFIHTQPKG
jgi:hypothetical protein